MFIHCEQLIDIWQFRSHGIFLAKLSGQPSPVCSQVKIMTPLCFDVKMARDAV
jgi:hypothetical protein